MVNLNKTLIRSIIIISTMAIISLLLFGISSVFHFLNTGADRTQMLHGEFEKMEQYAPEMTWAPLQNEGREMDAQTLLNIENNYLDAWYTKQVAYRNNTIEGIEDYYTERAEKNIQEFINLNKTQNIHIEGTTLEHHPKINFFSADGQLVVLTDHDVKEYKKIYKDEHLIDDITEITDYKMILLLEDGFWKIRHMVKTPSQQNQLTNHTPGNSNFKIKGINYYPMKNPWDTFGDDFDTSVLKQDFTLIKNAGLNTIRIFVQYDDFGKANVIPEKLDKLKQLLDIAEKQHLKVIVTLFDFYGNYDVLDWTLTQKHTRSIVEAFKNHNAILAWDVKNEPDLDFNSRGKENVIAWLEFTSNVIKSIDLKHAVTIGWAKIENATLLHHKLDLITFHYYEDFDLLESAYQKLKQELPHKNIVLGEFGVTSYKGIWKPLGSSSKKQATFHQKAQTIFQKNNIQSIAWTLYDFESVPTQVVGKLPWRKAFQKHFGFIDVNGNPKPAYKYMTKPQ